MAGASGTLRAPFLDDNASLYKRAILVGRFPAPLRHQTSACSTWSAIASARRREAPVARNDSALLKRPQAVFFFFGGFTNHFTPDMSDWTDTWSSLVSVD
jgi:hypothetical protein